MLRWRQVSVQMFLDVVVETGLCKDVPDVTVETGLCTDVPGCYDGDRSLYRCFWMLWWRQVSVKMFLMLRWRQVSVQMFLDVTMETGLCTDVSGCCGGDRSL